MKDFFQNLQDAFPVLKTHPVLMARLLLAVIIIGAIWAAKGWRKKIFGPLCSKMYGKIGVRRLSVSRKNAAPLEILVSPAQNLPIEVTRPLGAIVFISDPEQMARTTHDFLRAVFGLTPAECRVALLLGDGKSPREIAKLLALSPNTVKSQASTIYSKTGPSTH